MTDHINPTIKMFPSRKHVSLLRPTLDQIDIRDVAHHLAMQPRYLGGTETAYNNAQHSWFISMSSPREIALASLLHDAAEAYTGDLPGQFKHLHGMSYYRNIQDNFTDKIMGKFGVTWNRDIQAEIKSIEKRLYPWEEYIVGRDVLPDMQHPPYLSTLWNTKVAEKKFLQRFRQLWTPPESEFA